MQHVTAHDGSSINDKREKSINRNSLTIDKSLKWRWTNYIQHMPATTVQAFTSCTSRPDVCKCMVVQKLMDMMSIIKPSTSMAHVVSVSKLRWDVMRLSMHPCPGNWMTIGRTVVFYARATHAFSAGIRCLHCRVTQRQQTGWLLIHNCLGIPL